LGKGKATALESGTETPVVSADTIVVLENIILGKPADTADARRMLAMLSGKSHQVKTAVAVRYLDKTLLQVVTTEVHFRILTAPEIEWYAGTGEPMDKAGAYGIQGKGAVLVEKIEGSYDNVVGLPLTTVYEMFRRLNVPV
ncbi:MAG: septum formation protein Maf, partial [Acidaminococcaceae bacterium]|nr:septum formation protein Maf [Acidaminococcaceae bacterium]